MTRNPVRWFEIHVQDMDRARKFYETVFAVKLQRLSTPRDEIWSFPMQMDRMGTAGALVKREGVPSGGNSTILYFACEDCAVEEGRVAGAGGTLRSRKTAIGEYGFISMAVDPDGNAFGLHSMR